MASFPGYRGQIPGVYGPITYVITKTKSGYHIPNVYGSNSPTSFRSFNGSYRDIAKQILLRMTTEAEYKERDGRIGPFKIDLKPDIKISLCQIPESDFDLIELLDGITEELKLLSVLLPFS